MAAARHILQRNPTAFSPKIQEDGNDARLAPTPTGEAVNRRAPFLLSVPHQLLPAATLSRPWLPLQEERLSQALLRVLSGRRHLRAALQVHQLVRMHVRVAVPYRL
jgi:hypothetical protein